MAPTCPAAGRRRRRTRVDSGAPYLAADLGRVAHFLPRQETPKRRRVGLVCAGSPYTPWAVCGLAALVELGLLQSVPDIAWFALQQGAARSQQTQNGMQLIPINAKVSDFADTAAIISQLNRVVTVDTSVAYLAGAHRPGLPGCTCQTGPIGAGNPGDSGTTVLNAE